MFGTAVFAQHRVGVRAGLNYSKFNGPLELNEKYSITNGFHFGINYTYEMTSSLGFRAEILYSQRGTEQNYEGETYKIINPINPGAFESFVEIGDTKLDLKVSNAYLSIPFTVQYRINRKFEIFGGASLDFIVGPSARGKVDFVSSTRGDQVRYIQSYDHRYNSDVAGEYNTFIQNNPIIIVDGENVTVPKVVGAYYNFTVEQTEKGGRINGFDSHLIGGVNYFINRGFYFGARVEYGLLDVTNNDVDYSLNELDEDDNYIFRDDVDKSFNLSFSFGFRF